MIYKIIIKIITNEENGRYCCAIKMIEVIEEYISFICGNYTADETGGEKIHTNN